MSKWRIPVGVSLVVIGVFGSAVLVGGRESYRRELIGHELAIVEPGDLIEFTDGTVRMVVQQYSPASSMFVNVVYEGDLLRSSAPIVSSVVRRNDVGYQEMKQRFMEQ